MTTWKWASLTAGAAVCLTVLMGAAAPAHAQIAELAAQKITLKIDRKDVTVSGISSGAAMAHHLHIAHSADLVGVGMVAGPPFRCADYLLGNAGLIPTNPALAMTPAAATAIGLCTAYYKKMGAAGQFLAPLAEQPIDTAKLVKFVTDAAAARKVDDPKGVCGDRAFLIAGGVDDTVPGKVTGATADLYRSLMSQCGDDHYVKAHLNAETRPGMPHTMPTNSSAEPANCAAGGPYIADCDYPGAEEMLRFLHPARASAPQPNRPASSENLVKFSQRKAIGPFNPQGLMHENGYVYVPERCKQGETCSLHIALHGCHQNEDQINKDSRDPNRKYLFAVDAGYNDYAERAGIVVLYPQAAATPGMLSSNPNGCWDWWGYNGPAYYEKDAFQIRNIWKLVDALTK